jgi:hypothetical protein
MPAGQIGKAEHCRVYQMLPKGHLVHHILYFAVQTISRGGIWVSNFLIIRDSYFGIDTDMDGMVSSRGLHYDSVTVHVGISG